VKVVKVYDGDTITVASKFPKQSNNIYRFSVRLAGIDAPEMNADTIVEKEHAIESRNQLYDLVMNQTIVLDNIRVEKYGRLLAEVYLNDLHINSWLVENELAVPYDGGKKQKIEYS
jgi:endonuclease YncB( thermonuclease family)